MKQKRIKSIFCIFLLSAVFLFACTTGEELDGAAEKRPMTFNATVDGLTLTRGAGKDAWKVGDRIAISVDEGTGSKTYKVTNVTTGAMTPATAGDDYYWQKNTDERNILAWYPAEGVTGIDISDQSEGLAQFDFLTAKTTAKFSHNTALTFEHQMAKVICTLVAGNSITDLTKAKVSVSGYTTVSFTKGVVTGSGSNGWIIPNADNEVLVVPQDMRNLQFIRIKINDHEYFYTPTADKPNLTAGNKYKYTITVTEQGIEGVTVTSGVSWTDETITGSTDANTIFQITVPATGVTVTATSPGSLTENGSGSYSLSGGNEITVTADNRTTLQAKGLYVKTAENTYMLKGDISFTTN